MVSLVELEKQKLNLLLVIENWSAERLAFQGLPGSWSALQMFDHLVKVEAGILEAAKRGLAKPHKIGLMDRLGYWFIERVFRSQRKVKVPRSASQVLPDSTPELETILQKWQETRRDLAAFCAQLSPEQQSAGVFRHPVSGWMDVPRILGFMSIHMVHHAFQLSRIALESEGF